MEQVLLDNLRERLSQVLALKGVELVELSSGRERGRLILRFLVDKPGGITLGECAQLNREMGDILDAEDAIQQQYILEVASPGLDRPLKTTQDFQRCSGRLVKVILHQPLAGQNVWLGYLQGADEEHLMIKTVAQRSLNIPRKMIARARPEVA